MVVRGIWEAAGKAMEAYQNRTFSVWNVLDVGENVLRTAASRGVVFSEGRKHANRIAASETGQKIVSGIKAFAADNRGCVDLEALGLVKSKGSTETRNIYRAVSSEEYDDIFAFRGFRARSDGRSFQAKEFGNSFDETLEFANRSINIEKVAIIRVTIPENVYNRLNHMNLDRAIFKSRTPVVEPEMLDFFNKNIISIDHVF